MIKKIGILTVILVLFLSNFVMAEIIPVKIQKPEIKEFNETKIVSGKIVPYKSIRTASKIGGTVEEIYPEVGEEVKKDQKLIIFEQDNLKVQVKQAEAGVELAKANLDRIKNGATAEELAQVEAAYESAKASFAGAKKSLEIIEAMYKDKTSQKQQLSGAETQLKSAGKQMEIAKEQLIQAQIAYEQAANDYDRMKSLYEEGAITRKEFEGIETQYKRAKSALKTAGLGKEQAEINYEGALENHNIAKDVFQDPKSLKQQLDNARTQVEIARTSVKTAKANLDKVKKGAREEEIRSVEANLKQAEAALELAQLQYENSVVKSPHRGLIAAINVEEGEMVGAGTPVINLVDLSQVYVQVNVNARTLTNINVGEKVSVDILPLHNALYQGKIEIISPSINQQTQAYPVKILLNNKDNKIKGGMFADVEFILNKVENAVVIPLEAVIELDRDPHVFIIKEGKAVRREIEIGITNKKEVQVLKGIKGNEDVIVQGQNSLQNGDTIEVVE